MRVTPAEVYDYLRSRGVSGIHAVGMLANIKGESEFRPAVLGDNGASLGLFQHQGARRRALEQFGPRPTDWRQQVDFALSEPEGRQYLQQRFADPVSASTWFVRHFERPANPDADALRRGKYASNYHRQFGGDAVVKPVDVRMAATDDEIPREMRIPGNPRTGMAMEPVTDPVMLEEIESAFQAPAPLASMPGISPVTDPAVLAEVEAAFAATDTSKLVDPPRLSVSGSIGDTVSDAAMGAAMGGTMGWLDEAGGLAARLFAPPGMDPDVMQGAMQSAIRGRYREAKERSPVATTVGEIGAGAGVGMMVPGGTLTNLGRMAAIGGAEGLAAGAGYSDGDLADRAVGGATGAAIGAVGAPVVAGGIKALGTLASGLRRSVLSLPRADGETLIRQALDADMIDAQQARQLLSELGPEGMLADVGPNTQGLARLAANMSGEGKATMTAALEGRQAGQTQRVARAAGAALAPTATETWSDLLARTIVERNAQARPLYDLAFGARVRLTPVMQAVFGTRSGQTAVRRASESLQDKVRLGVVDRVGYDPASGEVTLRFLDQVKRHLGDMEQVAIRAGNNERAMDVGNLRRMLVGHIDDMATTPSARALGDANPFAAYAQARSVYAGAKELEEAGNLGAELLKGKKFARDIRPQLAEFTESEMEVFRLGLLQSISDVIDSAVSGETTTLARNTADVARKLTRDQRTRDLIRLGFHGREPQMQRFFRQLDAESRMKDTANVALAGSRTAPMLMDKAGAEQAVSATSNVMGALQGQYGPAVAAFVRFFANQPKLTPEVMSHVSRVLTDSRITDRQLAALAGGVQSVRVRMSQAAQGAIAGGTGVGGGVAIEYATRPPATMSDQRP